jgi:glutamate/tyrosine decarboxylase-like PLP-dependent enzyme
MTRGASYLPQTDDTVRDPVHYAPELSRRARGFALWALLSALGRQGIAQMIESHCRLARQMAQRLACEPGVEIVNDVELNMFGVQFGAAESAARRDELTRATVARIQSDGVCYVGAAQWRGRWIMRISVISWSTTPDDIERSAASIAAAWHGVRLLSETHVA